MDTTQVPEFKLAKVGKRRDKKRAGAFWLGGGGGGGFSGALGGSGVLIFKGVLMAVLAVMCVGAYNVGSSMAAGKKGALQKPKTFASKEIAVAPNANGAAAAAAPSGLAMVNGSLDGKTPEERAAEAAAAAAAAKAEADRKAQEEADAAKKAEEDAKAKAAAAAVDPNALAAAAAGAAQPGAADGGAKKGLGSGRFGALSTGLGGGHSGLAGGAGMSGGIGRAFAATGSSGKSSSFGKQSTATRTASKASAIGKANGKGRAFRQAVAANLRGQSARGATGLEGASAANTAAFDNNPGAGSAITGGGAGSGGAGAEDHKPGTDPSAKSGPTGCSGDCSGGAANVNHSDSSPWADEIKTAGELEIVAGIILLAAGIISKLSNAGGPWTQELKIIVGIMGAAVAVIGAVLLGLGQDINSKGGPGTMHMALGGLYVVGGAMVIWNCAASETTQSGIVGTIASWGGILGGLLGAGMGMSSMGSSGGDSSGKVPQNL